MITFIYKVLRSFKYATVGIAEALKERNMKVHVAAAIFFMGMGVWLQISKFEWIILFLLIGLVWAAEMINTQVEELSNIVRDELKLSYGTTRRARDVAAGAVLVLAFVSVIIGVMIFGPKLLEIYFS